MPPQTHDVSTNPWSWHKPWALARAHTSSAAPPDHTPGLGARWPAPVLISRVPVPPLFFVIAVTPVRGGEAEGGVDRQELRAAVHLRRRGAISKEQKLGNLGALVSAKTPMLSTAALVAVPKHFGCCRRDWSTLLKRWEQEENCPISTDDSSSLVSSSSESKWRYLSERAESKSQRRKGCHPACRTPHPACSRARWDLHPWGDSPVPNPRGVLGGGSW